MQLSDLAGNAMVMPVISAAILAALCTKAYARKLAADPAFKLTDLASSAASVAGASSSAASSSAASAAASSSAASSSAA